MNMHLMDIDQVNIDLMIKISCKLLLLQSKYLITDVLNAIGKYPVLQKLGHDIVKDKVAKNIWTK